MHKCRAHRRANRCFLDPEDRTKRQLAVEALRDAKECNLSQTWEHIYLGYAIGHLGEIEEANQLFDDLSKRNSFPWIEHNRGEMLRRLSSSPDLSPNLRKSLLKQSLHAQNIAVRVDPNRSSFLWEKMLVLMELEDSDAIDRFYQEVRSRGIPQRNVEIGAGLAYLDNHRHADSISALGKALELRAEVWLYNQLRDALRLAKTDEIREQAAELARKVERVLSDRSPQAHLPYELLLLFDAYRIADETEKARLAAVRLIHSCQNLDTRCEPTRSALQHARANIEPNLVSIGCIDNKLSTSTKACATSLSPFLEFGDHLDSSMLQPRLAYARAKCEAMTGNSDAIAMLQTLAIETKDPAIVAGMVEELRENDIAASLSAIATTLDHHPEHELLQASFWDLIHSTGDENSGGFENLKFQHPDLMELEWVRKGREISDRLGSECVVRINCGAKSDLRINGRLWLADCCFQGDDFSKRPQVVLGDLGNDVYSTMRTFWDSSQAAYRIPTGNGATRVKLHFAENYEYYVRVNGNRVFDIWIEDKQTESKFKIVDLANYAEPLVMEYESVVTDGVLDIAFVSRSSVPLLFGFEISRD